MNKNELNKYRWHLAAILLLGCLGLFVQSAAAHAVPVTTNPRANSRLEEPPDELEIRFNEPIVPELSQIMILTQAGDEVAIGPLQSSEDNVRLFTDLPPLEDGSYLVSWQVLSAVDGHTTSGTYSFGLGAEAAPVAEDATVLAQLSPLSAAARWLTATAVALILGFFSFQLFIWQPIFRGLDDLDEAEIVLNQQQPLRGLKLVRAGFILLLIALLLIFIDQATSFNLFAGGNISAWLGTQFGRMWLLRLVLSGLGFLLLWQLSKMQASWLTWLGFALGIGLALTVSMISHSAALLQNSLGATAVDLTHTLGAAIWAGGLLYLALSLHQARGLNKSSQLWLSLSLILNFSALAAASVGVLLLSGGYLAGLHIGSWTKLIGTAYGIVLLSKIGLAIVSFGLAGINLLYIKPRLSRAYDEPDAASGNGILNRFQLIVRLETITAFLILLAAGILTDYQRGLDAPILGDAAGRTVLRDTVDDLTVELTIEPALVGWNTFDVVLFDADGNPVADASEIAYRFTILGRSTGANEGSGELQENGRYRLEGNFISLISEWQIELAIRRPGSFDTFVPFRVEAGVGGEIRNAENSIRPLERAASFLTLIGSLGTGVLIVLLAIGFGFVAVRAAKQEWQLAPLLLLSILAFWLGAGQLFTFFDEEYTPSKFLTNPILPDSASVTEGQLLFEANCVVCHGEQGYGDGPAALTLNPPPVDFTAGHTETHPDGDLFYWIRNGVEDTAMPAFGDKFSREETWHLVNYVRRLSVAQ